VNDDPSRDVQKNLIFDNSARIERTYDVAAAYRLARAEVRVQLPLGALSACGKTWSFRAPRAHEIVGSNPTMLTEFHCGGVRAGTGRRLLIVVAQVRFLSPQLDRLRKSSGRMRSLSRKQVRDEFPLCVRVPRLPPEEIMCPWPSGKGARLPPWIGGFDSRGALWIGSVAQRQSRCLLGISSWVRVPPVTPLNAG
jgi:hypothetical protein